MAKAQKTNEFYLTSLIQVRSLLDQQLANLKMALVSGTNQGRPSILFCFFFFIFPQKKNIECALIFFLFEGGLIRRRRKKSKGSERKKNVLPPT